MRVGTVRPPHPPCPRGAVGRRHRDRHRGHRRGARHLALQPGRTARPAGQARHEPAAGAGGPELRRQQQRAADRVGGDGRPHRPGRAGLLGGVGDGHGAAQQVRQLGRDRRHRGEGRALQPAERARGHDDERRVPQRRDRRLSGDGARRGRGAAARHHDRRARHRRVARRPHVPRRRRDGAAAAGARHRPLGADRLRRGGHRLRPDGRADHDLRPCRDRPGHGGAERAGPDGEPGAPGRGAGEPPERRARRPARPPTARSRRCCSASAPWRCWSAASASRT